MPILKNNLLFNKQWGPLGWNKNTEACLFEPVNSKLFISKKLLKEQQIGNQGKYHSNNKEKAQILCKTKESGLCTSYNNKVKKLIDAFQNQILKDHPSEKIASCHMVLHQQVPIARAAYRLSLKTITARFILNKYINQGIFTVKKSDTITAMPKETAPQQAKLQEIERDGPYAIQEELQRQQEGNNFIHQNVVCWRWIFNGFGWILCPFST